MEWFASALRDHVELALFLSLGPRLLGVNLREAARDAEGANESGPAASARRDVATRAYRLPPALAGRSVAEIESLWRADERVIIGRMRRGGVLVDATPDLLLEADDCVAVTARSAAFVADGNCFAEYPTSATDLLLVSATIAIGGGVGLATLTIGNVILSHTAPVGVLLGGLILGHLRSMNPRFGRIPDASVSLLQSLGLAAFLALVGIQSGPGMVSALHANGVSLLLAGVIVTLVPQTITILIGKHFTSLNACVLLGVCAGAGTSAAVLDALERGAESRLPTLGYGIPCAVGNVLMAMGGTLLVLASP